MSDADKDLALNPDIPVTRQTPPTFLLQAEDDHVDNVNDSLAYYIALKNAGVPVEMHLYAQGGHAFGLRRTKFPITGWPQLVETWLEDDRDDFGVGVAGSRMTNWTCRFAVPVAPRTERSLRRLQRIVFFLSLPLLP